MTNFGLITQNTDTLDDFISAIIDDALEAKGCSLDLKLLYLLQGLTADDIFMDWKEWLKQEAEDDTILLPNHVRIERWRKAGKLDG